MTDVPPLAPDSLCVATLAPSPNFGPRRFVPGGAARLDMLVLHYTGMAGADAAIALLQSPAAEVSCHYVVREDGEVVQMVAEAERAWHAGLSSWEGIGDVNSRSIGIEIVNGGHDFGLPDFPEPQVAAVIALCADILARHPIRADRVVAHSDIAPARKRDPGERFPWCRLHAAGIGHWVPAAADAPGPILGPGDTGAEVRALRAALAAYGYGVAAGDLYDAELTQVVAAFQRHFRPDRVDGLADPATRATLAALLASRPADAAPLIA